MPDQFNIPTTQDQLQKALAIQGNILFQAGIAVAESQASSNINAYAKYNQAAVRRNAVPGDPSPDGRTGQLGTPVMGDLSIAGGTYTVFDPAANADRQRSYPGVKIDTVLIQVSQSKRIVKTFVQGLPYSVKEYIALGDYEVKVEGVITGPNSSRRGPTTSASSSDGDNTVDGLVNALVTVLTAPVALQVSSDYLANTYGITSLVVDSYHFPQTPGSYSYQAFTVNFSSDLPVPLTINIPNS